jgi:glucose/arabinose dehydrogenase
MKREMEVDSLKENACSESQINKYVKGTRGGKSTQGCWYFLSVFCLLTCLFSTRLYALPDEPFDTLEIAKELKSPWSMAQLSDNEWVITERQGTLVMVSDKTQTRVSLGLDDLYVAGQGGLLDVVTSPNFNQDKTLYFSYAQGTAKANRLAVGKVVKNGNTLGKAISVFSINTDKATPVHYAGRLLFLTDGTLLITSGDGFDYREQAQVRDNHLGKILRINADGSIPTDNPFPNSAVFSVGHRNTQGLVYAESKNTLFSHEHGPAGGDELNIIESGRNYGWPVITQGNDYSGARISPFRDYEGMTKPVVDWTPSIAPSGLAYYGAASERGFKSLSDHLLLTTLVNKRLYAVDTNKADYPVLPIFDGVTGRLRDVKVSSTGAVAVLTDGEEAELLLLTPKQ